MNVPPVRQRPPSRRVRHGTVPRGPLVLPGPLTPSARTPVRTGRQEFDDLVAGLVARQLRRWGDRLAEVEFGTEEVPDIPELWGAEPVPFGALVDADPPYPARIVVFRRPVELRATTYADRAALVNEVLREHIRELLGDEYGDAASP